MAGVISLPARSRRMDQVLAFHLSSPNSCLCRQSCRPMSKPGYIRSANGLSELRRWRPEMKTHSAPATSARVVARWQARGHAAVHDALSLVYPHSRDFDFDSADSDTRFECAIVRLANLRLLRIDTSGFQARGCTGPDRLRVTLPVRGGVEVISGRRKT